MNWQSVTLALVAVAFGTDARPQQLERDLQDFVRAPTFPTSYRELANSYDATATPHLIDLLNSSAEEAHWVRIAALLGAIGDERAVDALIAFIEKPVGAERLSLSHAEAYSQSITSLGLLVNRTGNERALKYLIDGLTPSVWRQRRVEGIASWATSYEEYDRALSKYALFGLALSGHPEARQALVALQLSPTLGQLQFRRGLDSTLAQWLEVHQLVAERGLAGMYEHYDAERLAKAEREVEEANRLRAERAQQQRLREAQNPRSP
jgi:HEAT repeat protein